MSNRKSLPLCPPSPVIPLFLIAIILKPFLQVPTQPCVAPKTFHSSASDLSFMIPVIKPNHALSFLITKQVSIRAVPPINHPARRPCQPRDEI